MSIKTRMQDSSNWILNAPESLVILMLMGTGIASLFFSVLALAMGFNKKWVFVGLFGVFAFAAVRQFIKIFKMVKKTSLKEALGGGITANEFVWHKDKYGNKLDGGIKNGNGEDDSQGNGTSSNKEYKEDAGGQREDNRKPKPANIRFGEYIQSNDGDSKEVRNDGGGNSKARN